MRKGKGERRVQNLLFKIAENNETAVSVASAVEYNFDKLPEDVRNGLLIKLAENSGAVWSVVPAVAKNFDKLPENVQNLLFKIADSEYAASRVAEAVDNHFEGLLVRLSKSNEAVKYFCEKFSGGSSRSSSRRLCHEIVELAAT